MADGEALVDLIDFPLRDGGAPLPALFADDSRLVLAYLVPDVDESIVVEFERSHAHLFGGPNDEAMQGHRLAEFVRAEGHFACEVLRSAWIAELCARNSVHRNHGDWMFADLRHFIFWFKDTTLEVVAKSYSWSREPGFPRDCIARRIARSV